MKSVWFGTLKDEDRENFRQTLKNSKIVLDKLHEIVYNMYREKRDVTFTDYDSPSWSHRQAHTNGYCEALEQILNLVDIEKR